MKPDSKQEYSLDEVALMKAEIDPRQCYESVQCAIKKNLPGCHRALSYLDQLCEQAEKGQLDGLSYVEPEDGVIASNEIFITKEEALQWQPESLPIPPASNKHSPNDKSCSLLAGKSKQAYQRLIKAFCMLVERYETGQKKPNYFENKDIVMGTGRLSAAAIGELLKEIYPDTPKSARKFISEAQELVNDALELD